MTPPEVTEGRIEAVYEELWADNSTSDSTTDRYIRGADDFFDWLADQEVDPFNVVARDFRRFMNAMVAEDYAYGTLQPLFYGPRAFYRAAEDLHDEQQELIEAGRNIRVPEIPDVSDPTEPFSLGDFTNDSRSKQSKGLEANDEHHKLSQGDIDDLVEHAPSPKLRNSLIIRLMYQCCLRRSEVVRLKVGENGDINRDEHTIDVPAVKGNKGRDAPIPYQGDLIEQLPICIDVERKGQAKASTSDYLFPTDHAERISEDRVSAIVRTAAEQAGLQKTLYTDNMGREKKMIHSHTLRASGAHRLWDKSQDIYLVSKVLGHSDVDTTERYLDVDKDDIISKVREAW